MAATAIRTPLLRLRAGRLDDARLAALAATGDERAFEVMYDRHHRPLLGFCRHMLSSQEESEDALQQTFLRAHRSLVTQGAPDDLRPWLFAIARNRCLSMLAARKAAAVPVEELEPATDGLSAGVEDREDLRELLGDIARLPDDQRSALVLAEIGDLSHAEIARVIEVPTAKVKALVHQARSRLIADRDARETPCTDVREQLSTARGGELRRGPLRRHLAICEPCRAYKDAVAEQRSALALVLPVLPSAGLKDTIFGALGGGGGGAAAAASGGAVAGGGAVSGGGLAAKSLGAKLAIGAALAGGAGSGAVVVKQVATAPERPVAAAVAADAPPERTPAPTPAVARRRSAEAVLVDSMSDRASETGVTHRSPAVVLAEDRAEERRAAKHRHSAAREQAARDRDAEKRDRVLDRAQQKDERAAAKEQRTAARAERLAAREERLAAHPGRRSAGSKRSASSQGNDGAADRSTTSRGATQRSAVAAPRTPTRAEVVKPKAVATPTPVPTPSLTPERGKSDAAKGRVVDDLAP